MAQSTSILSPPLSTSSATIEPPKENVSDSSPAQPPPRSPSPNKCSICLGELINKCYTNSCCHQFCFGCLLEWSKVKPECPLCKSSFRSIYHNIRSMTDYDEYHVPTNTIPHLSIRLTTSDPYAHILGADINLGRHELDHGYTSGDLSSRYLRERFQRIRDPRVIRILEVGPVSERRAFDAYLNSASSLSLDNPFYSEPPEYFSSFQDESPASGESTSIRGYQNRRRIYDRCQWVMPFHSTLQPGTVFFPSVEYFRTHPSGFGRINSWLYREVTVLLALHRSRTEMGFVYDLILGLLLRFDIRSREFREMVKSYFGARVKHFQHEFYHFVLSGMRAESYDRVASYPNVRSNGVGSSEGRYSGPPPVVTLGDSDDEVVEDEVVVIDDDIPASTQSMPDSTRDDTRTARPRRPPPELLPNFGPIEFPSDPWDANFELAELENQLRNDVRDVLLRVGATDLRHTGGSRRIGRRISPVGNSTDESNGLLSHWQLPSRPLTDEDFRILNLRSRTRPYHAEPVASTSTAAAAAATSPMITTGETDFPGPSEFQPQPLPAHQSSYSTIGRYPLRSRGTNETAENPKVSSFHSQDNPITDKRIGRKCKHSSKSLAATSITSTSTAHGSHVHLIVDPLQPTCSLKPGSGGVRMNLGGNVDTGTHSRSGSSLLNFWIDRAIEPKDEAKTKKSQTKTQAQAQDDEDCLFAGIHPVFKKPPLAVITISSEDEEGVESSSKLKDETREQITKNDLDDFLSWSNSQQSLALDDSSTSGSGNDSETNLGRETRRSDEPSTFAASISRARKTTKKHKKSKGKTSVWQKKADKSLRKKRVASTSSSDTEDYVEEKRKRSSKSSSIRISGKWKSAKKQKVVLPPLKEKRKRNMDSLSKSTRGQAKRSKKMRDNSSDSSESSSSSGPRQSRLSSNFDSIEANPDRTRSQSSSSSTTAVDLRTRGGVERLGSSQKRWESNDDDSNIQPMVFDQRVSHSDSDDSSVGFATGRTFSSTSSDSRQENTEQTNWSPVPSESYGGHLLAVPSLSPPSSSSSSAQTEDEAGLNARDIREDNINQGHHNYVQSLIDSYNSTPATGSRYPVSDFNPTSGLDLRLNSAIESWRQYRSNPNSDDIGSMTGFEGYWSSANDWLG